MKTIELKPAIFPWHVDGGHAWLEVEKFYLDATMTAKQISSFSYQSNDGTIAYLEEDCDAYIFLKAFKSQFSDITVESPRKYASGNSRSFVRSLPSYQVNPYVYPSNNPF